jgi:hypothetical protein
MMVYNFYNHDMFKKNIPSYHDPHQHRTKDTSESSACLRKRRLEMTIQSGEKSFGNLGPRTNDGTNDGPNDAIAILRNAILEMPYF